MTSHFSTIGFPVQNYEELMSFADKACKNGNKTRVKFGSYIQWKEKNGAELWIQKNLLGKIIDINPHFSGISMNKVGLQSKVSRPKDSPLEGAYYCWAEPKDARCTEGSYPFVFDSPDFLINPPKLPAIIDVQISAFAHDIQVYSDEESFNKADTKYAVQSFIPSGLFSPGEGAIEPPVAYAIFTGKVIQCAAYINEFTNCKYEWALVKAFGGEYDVVVDSSLLPAGIEAGNIVFGSFWLSGRILPRK